MARGRGNQTGKGQGKGTGMGNSKGGLRTGPQNGTGPDSKIGKCVKKKIKKS